MDLKRTTRLRVDRISDECFQAITTSDKRPLVQRLRADRLSDECFQAITTSNKATGPKVSWNIINLLLKKCKILRIPPLLVADIIITDSKEKVKLFNDSLDV